MFGYFLWHFIGFEMTLYIVTFNVFRYDTILCDVLCLWWHFHRFKIAWYPSFSHLFHVTLPHRVWTYRTPYLQEQVNIGSGPPGTGLNWFRSVSSETRYINTITFENKSEKSPTLVMVHGYGASQGFFFRNFDALANHFNVIAIDQLGWALLYV